MGFNETDMQTLYTKYVIEKKHENIPMDIISMEELNNFKPGDICLYSHRGSKMWYFYKIVKAKHMPRDNYYCCKIIGLKHNKTNPKYPTDETEGNIKTVYAYRCFRWHDVNNACKYCKTANINKNPPTSWKLIKKEKNSEELGIPTYSLGRDSGIKYNMDYYICEYCKYKWKD